MRFIVYLWAAILFNSNLLAIMNGEVANESDYKEIVQLIEPATGRKTLSATLVGPRVLITHSKVPTKSGQFMNFIYSGKKYEVSFFVDSNTSTAKYPISVGLINEAVPFNTFASIGKTPQNNMSVTLLGYGCTSQETEPDDRLRKGTTNIQTVEEFQIISSKSGGPVLCYKGDMGGPVYYEEGGKKFLLGVHSSYNINVDPVTNYAARSDVSSWTTFLKNFASQNNVDICGVTKDCNSIQPPGEIACSISGPTQVKQNQKLTLTLTMTKGSATFASIDGVEINIGGGSGSRDIFPSDLGPQTAIGFVKKGIEATNTCKFNYTVVKDDPQPGDLDCKLVASQNQVKQNQKLTLALNVTKGTATFATIDDQEVTLKDGFGSRDIFPSDLGPQTARGFIKSGTNTKTCTASYTVVKEEQPDMPTCVISANPKTIKLTQKVTLTLAVTGKAARASIDGIEVSKAGGSITITPAEVRPYMAVGKVETADGRFNNCTTDFEVVKNDGVFEPPTCDLVAEPNIIEIGKSIGFRMRPSGGPFTAATINGNPIFAASSFMLFQTPSFVGKFEATGVISGPGGTNTCSTQYIVENKGGVPEVPNLTVVPTFCGDNKLAATLMFVKQVCLAVLKKDSASRSLSFSDAVQITFTDGKVQIQPILGRKVISKPSAGNPQGIEEVVTYANRSKMGTKYYELDTVTHRLLKNATATGAEVPAAISGDTVSEPALMIPSYAYSVPALRAMP
jgi:V8-like Glu-specific endopeptidase